MANARGIYEDSRIVVKVTLRRKLISPVMHMPAPLDVRSGVVRAVHIVMPKNRVGINGINSRSSGRWGSGRQPSKSENGHERRKRLHVE